MKHKISGSIAFELDFDTETSEVQIDYTTGIENDLAVLAIATMILKTSEDFQRQEKERTMGERKRNIATTLNYTSRGRAGAAKVLGILVANYDAYKAEQAKNEDKEQVIKDFIKDAKVTTESGVIPKEEAEKLLGERIKLLRDKAEKGMIEQNNAEDIKKFMDETFLPKDETI